MSMNAEKEKLAIQRLQSFEPDDGYYLCYSGGKDSDAIRILAQLAGVKHDSHHNLTTVDAPETIKYIKSIPDVIIDPPEISMWRFIEKKGIPPTRLMRYCCSELKEKGGKGRLKITGVRWSESRSRKDNCDIVKIIGKPKNTQKLADELHTDYKLNPKGGIIMNMDNSPERRLVEQCYRTTSTMINPIIDWTDDDVWAFLDHYGCKSNPLYQCGQKRIGCICCPLSGFNQMKLDAKQYPIYKLNYIKAFDRMLITRQEKGLPSFSWQTGEEVFKWWVGDDPNQITFEDLYNGIDVAE